MNEYTVFGFHERDGVSFACDVTAEDKHDAISQARKWATTLPAIGRGNIIVATVSVRPSGDDEEEGAGIASDYAKHAGPERAQLEEMDYPHEAVRLLSDEKAKLIYEAEVDAAHEATGGESRRWDHEIQPFADLLDEVRGLATGVNRERATVESLRGRLAVIAGKIPPAVWTLID